MRGNIIAITLCSILILGFTFVQDADAGSVGRFTSIAIGNDGFPVVSYFDDDNADLKFVHCTSVDCSTFDNPIRLDTLNFVGFEPSIAIAADGFPIISYYDSFNGDLRLVHCSSIDCSTFDAPLVLDHPGGVDVGRTSSITIGTDTFPIVSYHDSDNGALKFVHCTSIDCSTFDNPIVLDASGNLGNQGIQSSITIGIDGFPAISYHGISNIGERILTFVHCTSVDCSTIDSRLRLDIGGEVGLEPSIAIGTDGFPVTSYAILNPNFDVKLVHCTSLNCS